MNIITTPETFTLQQIANIEDYYKAKYICETCIRNTSGGWANFAVAVFFTDKPHPKGSNWFGVFTGRRPGDDDDSLMICNAITAVGEAMAGIVADNGDVIYSRYRHDFRESPDGSVSIDGGRDYTRNGGKSFSEDEVVLRIVKDELVIIGPVGEDE